VEQPGDQHRREVSRVVLHLRAEVRCPGDPVLLGSIQNLGLQGCFFLTETPPGVGRTCDIRVFLSGTELNVRASARVVRHGPGGCALRFEELIGLESLDHLRNLVLYNSGTPQQVEQEIQTHLGLRRG
jgi:PilZ domain